MTTKTAKPNPPKDKSLTVALDSKEESTIQRASKISGIPKSIIARNATLREANNIIKEAEATT